MARRRKEPDVAMTVAVDVPTYAIEACFEEVRDRLSSHHDIEITMATLLQKPAVREYIEHGVVEDIKEYAKNIDTWFIVDLDYETVFADEIRAKEEKEQREEERRMSAAQKVAANFKETAKPVFVADKDLKHALMILAQQGIKTAL